MLPFDRSLAGSLAELFAARLPLREEAVAAGGERITVELRCAGEAFARESPRAVFRVDLAVDGELIEALERESIIAPPSAWRAPERALDRIDQAAPRWRATVAAAADLVARRGLPLGEGSRFGAATRELAPAGREAIMDALFDCVDLGEALLRRWPDAAPVSTVERPADRCVVAASPGFPAPVQVTTPVIDFERGGVVVYRDGYRVGSGQVGKVDRLVGLGAAPDLEARRIHEALVGAAQVVILPEPDLLFEVPPTATATIVCWEPRPGDDRLTTEHFFGRAPRRLLWLRGDLEAALAAVDEALPAPAPVAGSLAEWLAEGIEAGRWVEPRWRPPILVELGGRHALAALIRSDAPIEVLARRVDGLIALGVDACGDADHDVYDADGRPIELPLVEAALHGGDALFHRLLRHVDEASAREAAFARLRDEPRVSAAIRAGAWR